MGRKVTTTLRLPEELHEAIRGIADREDRSLNRQVERWIREGIERYRTEHPQVCEQAAERK
jgi:hypothetical protein